MRPDGTTLVAGPLSLVVGFHKREVMDKIKLSSTGGARVGWVNATWPFAKLNVSQNKIDLNATLIGS